MPQPYPYSSQVIEAQDAELQKLRREVERLRGIRYCGAFMGDAALPVLQMIAAGKRVSVSLSGSHSVTLLTRLIRSSEANHDPSP